MDAGSGSAGVGEEDLGEGLAVGDRHRAGAGAVATLGSAPNGLEPVLAEGCEVDEKVRGVGQAGR